MGVLTFLVVLSATLLGTLVFVAIANIIRFMAEHENVPAEQPKSQTVPGQHAEMRA